MTVRESAGSGRSPSGGGTGATGRRSGRRRSAVTAVLAVVAALFSFVGLAAPAQAVPAAVSTSRNVADFPRWYADQNGVRLEPCIDPADAHCVVLSNPPIYDSALPTVWPSNYPDEWFYNIVDSDRLTTPGCAGTRAGRALVRHALEGTFLNGVPVPGEQMTFARTRITATGLCPSSNYTFTTPYGQIALQTDTLGSLARNVATTDIGCAAAPCDFAAALSAPLFRGFLRWDPAVAPAADPGYLGGAAGTLHPIVGASGVGSANLFRITGPGLPVAGLTTNLFAVSGKIAGPLHATPESADFGAQPINTPSAVRAVTFTNVSPAPLAITGVAVAAATAPWTIAPGGTCTGTVAVDATCTVNLVFAPTVTGDFTANLQITHGSFRSPTVVPLKGSGTAAVAPSVTSAPAALDFHRVITGTTSPAQGIVVHNNGPGAYVVDGVTIVDDVAGGGFAGDAVTYLPVKANTCPVAGLDPGQDCTISIDFKPTDQRPTKATVQVAGHVGATSVPLTAGVSGRGGIAQSSAVGGVGPAGKGADGFPTWYQDDRGVRLNQCFVNDPTRCVLLAEPAFNPAAAITFPTNYPSEAFYYIADSDRMTTPGCGTSPAGTAQFRAAVEQTFVNGAPVAGEQMVFDRLRVNVTSGLCAGRVYKFVHPYGEFTFTADTAGSLPRSPGTVDEGCVPTSTAPCDFNLASASPVSDGFLRWPSTAAGIPAGGFLGDAGVLHAVVGAPYTKPGATTPQNQVELVDTTTGAVVASTNLFTVAGRIDPSQTVTRYQTVTPSAVAFPSQDVGTTSAGRTVTVTSVGTAGLTVAAATVTGANAADFRVTANTCAAQPVGTACTITVAFAPTAAGARTATLTVASNAVNTWSGVVALSGTGVGVAAPTVTVTPATLGFGTWAVGTPSTVQTTTVRNAGATALTVSAVGIAGANAADFTQTNTCVGAAVPAGGTCTVSVRFQAAVAGARTATLTVTTNGGADPTVALTGTGGGTNAVTVTPATVPAFTGAVGATSVAQNVVVTNSGTAQLAVTGVTLTGVNAGDFVVTSNGCTTAVAPAGTCTVGVAFAPTAAGTRTATLNVATTAGTVTRALTGTVAAVPAAPVIGAVAQGAGALTPSWTAPANGGSAITGYEVRVVSGGVQVGALRPAGAAATSLLVTGLTPGTSYQFQVRAANAVGTGAFSALSAATVVPTVPGAPTIGTASGGAILPLGTEATARWTAPANTGGTPITGYVVHALRMSSTAAGATVVSDTPVTVGPGVTSRVVTGLAFLAPYRFEVEAVNAAGTSARSARSNAVTAS